MRYLASSNTLTNISYMFHNCTNLNGQVYCGNNVTNMAYAYWNCRSLTAGSPLCPENVTNMNNAFAECRSQYFNDPVACGNKVIDMAYAYHNCHYVTGSPICGPNVNTLDHTYYGCANLTGPPVSGNNVTDMTCTYYGCSNLYGDMYVYNAEVSNAVDCFKGRSNSTRLNIICTGTYLGLGGRAPISYNTFTNQNIVGVKPTWTNKTSDKTNYNEMVYNSKYNIYVYWHNTGISSGGSND